MNIHCPTIDDVLKLASLSEVQSLIRIFAERLNAMPLILFLKAINIQVVT